MKRLRQRLLEDRNLFYFILFATLFVIFLYLKLTVSTVALSSLFAIFRSAAADTSLLFLLCLCLRGKWKIALLPIPPVLTSIFIINALYFRYFGDLLPSPMYSAPGTVNDVTLQAARTAFRVQDLFVFIFSFVPAAYALFLRKRFFGFNASRLLFIADGVLLIASWLLTVRSAYRIQRVWDGDITFFGSIGHVYEADHMPWIFTYRTLNFTGYAVKCILTSSHTYFTLTEEQKGHIQEYLRERTEKNRTNFPDSVKTPKNLVFIVVESLPAKAMEISGASTVAPFLHSISTSGEGFYVPLHAQTQYGNSSDAQFIYNTGLLPLRSEALVLYYALNDYPSLSKALDKGASLEVIGEPQTLWNHNLTTQSYGFDRLIDMVGEELDLDQDAAIFQRATEELKTLRSPFFLFITTLSMHPPYVGPNVTPGLDRASLGTTDPIEIEYLQRLNHLDRQVEAFVGMLKERGLFDDTLIVIAGDHQILDVEIMPDLQDNRVAAFLINAPQIPDAKRSFYQTDLFPTILDIMRVDYSYFDVPYTGVGTSMYAPSGRPITDEDYRISEWLIKGR